VCALAATAMPRLPRSVEQRLRVADQQTGRGRCMRAANRYADTKELWRAREREIELETRQADSRGASNSTGGDAVGEADTRVVDSRPTQHSASEAEEWRPSTFFASKRKRGEAWRVACGWCELRCAQRRAGDRRDTLTEERRARAVCASRARGERIAYGRGGWPRR
jgi:hypothetical protein